MIPEIYIYSLMKTYLYDVVLFIWSGT